MYAPFFVLAAQSPSRQATFRKAVVAHVALVAAVGLAVAHQGKHVPLSLIGHVMLTAGIVEGALLVGWRLTQLPKSQALEFLLVSPLQPARVFLAEAAVGLALLALVTLSGLPILAVLAGDGQLDPLDILPLLVLPLTWGAITGLGLAAWAYEPRRFRKVGEVVLMAGILLYLVVGVLAGENLRHWLDGLPETWQLVVLRGFHGMHEYNPYGTLRHWLDHDVGRAFERTAWLQAIACACILAALLRASYRLQGHFHERHYEPARDVSNEKRPPIGHRPLAWWAVKRVSEYSGRINLWLAGGFCLLYAAYLLGGDHWPAWMGRRIFAMCDAVGGAAALSTALVLLAAVPAAFQYGLWDSSAQDRCRRLELLLLTDLRPRDYWDAAFAAAWRRGRGYFAIALVLWTAALLGGRLTVGELLASVAAGVMVWALYFALGFRAFARGAQANGLGLLLTVGLPLAAWGLGQAGLVTVAGWLPPGMVYRAGVAQPSSVWLLGPLAVGATTLWLARRGLAECDVRLRQWYDANHGNKVMT